MMFFLAKKHPARGKKNSIIKTSAFKIIYTRIFAVAFFGPEISLSNLRRFPSVAPGVLRNVKVQALIFVVAIREFRQISFRK